jgi:GT2 family glycosyltransferase
MAIYVVIPVFNRLAQTKRMLSCLQTQSVAKEIDVLVIDDGSTDGTKEFLHTQEVQVIQGDGSLWWGGAVHKAFQLILKVGKNSDYVLLLNNDTVIEPNYVKLLLDLSRKCPKTVIGSIVRDINSNEPLAIGAIVDAPNLRITEIANLPDRNIFDHTSCNMEVDVLSGRGLFMPLEAIKAAGGMRPIRLPHYLADYELSLRIKRAGWSLIINPNIAVLSANDFGSDRKIDSLAGKYFSRRSPSYLPATLSFWWQACTTKQRPLLLIRIFSHLLSSIFGNRK